MSRSRVTLIKSTLLKYPAEVTFAGPRLWNVTHETLEVDYINTRVEVGVSYYVKLDKNAEISLKNIWWPQQKPFVGAYISNGESQALICKQSTVQ